MARGFETPVVLVVDDEPENVAVVRRVCRNDYEVRGFTDPKEALEHYKGGECDAVIVDFRMPKMNGAEFVRRLHELDPEAQCILVTAFQDLDEVRQLRSSGLIRRVIVKPIHPGHLKAAIAASVTTGLLRRVPSKQK